MSQSDDEARAAARRRTAAARRRTAAALAAYKAIPESAKTPVRQPEKYAFPLGLDDFGTPFPNREGAD